MNYKIFGIGSIMMSILLGCSDSSFESNNSAPIITLKGKSIVYTPYGDIYEDKGAIAIDKEEGNLTDNIVVTSNINIDVNDTYIVTYNVTDKQGLEAIPVSRNVTVSTNIVYEDAEDGSVKKWKPDDNNTSEVLNIFDQERQSRVIKFVGKGTGSGYKLGEVEGKDAALKNNSQFVVSWDMNFTNKYGVLFRITTETGSFYLYYTPVDVSRGKINSSYYHTGLGKSTVDNGWHSMRRNLSMDLEVIDPGNTILELNAVVFRGNGSIDNLTFHTPDI
jgi:hypothetical protein